MNKVYLIIVASCLLAIVLITAVVSSVNMLSAYTLDADLITKPPRGISPDGMVWVAGGSFQMGTEQIPEPGESNPDRVKPDEGPAHRVELDGYWLDATPVTNAQFLEFVEMTGYVTFAEKTPTREDFARSGIDPRLIPDDALRPGSLCFNQAFDRNNLVTGAPGWEYQVWMVVEGANWRQPDGPESSIENRLDHPVVHLTWDDAVAYCKWAGKRLPTEAEFEFAARNRGQNIKYPWGDELTPDGKYMANFWQGEFPTSRLVEDGYLTTSPVKAFPPNPLGLYDMAGNVWEWCSDYFHTHYYDVSPRRNPQGPLESFDAREPGLVKRAQRGGSFLCNTNSCTGYRTAARMAGEIVSSSFHNGFRCALDTAGVETYQAAQAKIEAWRTTRATTDQQP